MYPSILPTTVGGMKGLILENENIRVVLTPEFGARIVSLIYKPTETEFAWHNPRVPMMRPAQEPESEDLDLNGFFDCVPTCEPCEIKGRKLPMLGEVASEPWRVLGQTKTSRSVTVKMQRKCEVYPLTVHKSLTISKREAMLSLDYRLVNFSDEVLEYHYSGHHTLNINPHYRIVLPPEVTKLKLGMIVTDRLGKSGDEVSWPTSVDKDGNTVDLSKVGGPCDGTGENLYSPKLRDSWCAAFNEPRKEAIGFSFEAQALPYILFWANNGGYGGHHHIALEPSTGRPDNLKVAVNEWKNFATLEPRAEASWSEKVFVNHNIKHVARVSSEKGIMQ